MSLSKIRFCLVLGVALAIPGFTLAQSAPATPPSVDPAAPVAQPAQPAAPAPQTRSGTAVRATQRGRTPAVDESLAPTIAAPYTPAGAFYYPTQGAYSYSRFAAPLDKEMQELMKKEADLSKKTGELIGSLKGAAADKKAEIRTQLVAAVEEHFAVRQAQREHQLKRIEEEVKKLREAIEKRTTSKKEIIERRIAELTGEDTIGF
jgi:hypothetical protein